MKLLFDILHPAHVHFFRNAVAELGAAGHRVLITSRDKDLTHRLLDLYGLRYECLSREARGKGGMARELWTRNLRLRRIIRREKPRVLASIGGISTAQVGFLTRTPNLVFYDTENATLSNLLSYPFATAVVTPACYEKKVLGRHVTYRGYHELAYLHPARFQPDPGVLESRGIDPGRPFSVVRFVSWKAMHDVRAFGFSLDKKRELVRSLSEFGGVYITSEAALPEDLEPYRLPMEPHHVHHLLAFARLFIGESATMASESAILGTPAVYVDVVGRGYTNEQERKYGLVSNFRPSQPDAAIARAREILAADRKNDDDFQAGRRRLLEEKLDVTSFMVDLLLRTAGRSSVDQ